MRTSPKCAVVFAVVLMVAAHDPAAAMGGRVAPEDRWDPRHLSVLPAEAKSAVARYERACGPPAAEHSFSTWIDGSGRTFLILHFEHLRCRDKSVVCRPRGCLHEVFVSTAGGFRSVSQRFVGEMELLKVNGSPALKLMCPTDFDCATLLLWNGSSFGNRSLRGSAFPAGRSNRLEERNK